MFDQPDVPSSRRHAAIDMGQGAEVAQHVQRGAAPSIVQYAGGTPDVPMQQLDATPAVPPGMSSQIGAPPSEARQVSDVEATARSFDEGEPLVDIEPVEHGQAVRRPVPPGLQQDPTPRRTAQMNVAAHRRMGLRTVNQQPTFDTSALQAHQQRPARFGGITPPPFMQGGTAQIRSDVGADPRPAPLGRGGGPPDRKPPAGGGFGPVRKPRGVRWGDTGRDPLMQALVKRRKQQQWEEKPAQQQAIRSSISDEEKRQEAQRRRQGPYAPGPDPDEEARRRRHGPYAARDPMKEEEGASVPGKPPPKPGPLPPGPGKPRKKIKKRRRVSFGGYESRTIPNVLREREDREGYKAAGMHLGIKYGRNEARRQHRRTVDQMRRENTDLMGLVKTMQGAGETLEARVRRGAQQIGARDQSIRALQAGQGRQGMLLQTAAARLQAGGRQLSARDAEIRRLNLEGKRLEGEAKTRVRGLQEGMGREGLARQRAQERVGQLLQEGRSLESTSRQQISALQQGMGREGLARQRAEGEVSRLQSELLQAKQSGSADKQRLERDLAAAKASLAESRRRPAAKAAGAPIITVSAPGGGGASSSSSGGAASGGGGQQAAARAPDLSKVVEAVKKVAEAAQAAKKAPATKGSTKGITQARRRYTDKRKITLAALRSLKSKRIREFNNKTKKLPKTERDKQRREFKKKVNAQYKEVTTKFPTARGMKSVGTIRELIKKLEGIKTGS